MLQCFAIHGSSRHAFRSGFNDMQNIIITQQAM